MKYIVVPSSSNGFATNEWDELINIGIPEKVAYQILNGFSDLEVE